MPVADQNILNQWPRHVWRQPDHEECHYAIWYGPDGADGDVATTIAYEEGYFTVTEYARHPDGGDLISSSTEIGAQLVRDTVFQVLGIRPAEQNLHLWAVGIGVAALAYYGGDEDTAIDLPRGGNVGPFWCGRYEDFDDDDEGLLIDDDLNGVSQMPAWIKRGGPETPWSSDKDFRHVLQKLQAMGVRMEKRRSGHIVVYPPNGSSPVFTSGTPSDHRALKNFKSNLRKAGIRI